MALGKPTFEDIKGVGILGYDSHGDITITFTPPTDVGPIEYLICNGTTCELYQDGKLVNKFFVWDFYKLSNILSNMRMAIEHHVESLPFDDLPPIGAVMNKAKNLKIIQ